MNKKQLLECGDGCIETKYHDETLGSINWENQTIARAIIQQVQPAEGYVYKIGSKWYSRLANYTSDINVGPSGGNHLMATLRQGSTALQRIGDIVDVKRIKCKVMLEAFKTHRDQAGQKENTTFGTGVIENYMFSGWRVVLVRDKQCYASETVDWSDIYGGGTLGKHVDFAFQDPRNVVNLNRFDVLYDEYVTLSNNNPIGCVDIDLKLNEKIRFGITVDDDKNTTANCRYFVLATCDIWGENTDVGNYPDAGGDPKLAIGRVRVKSRIYFKDA
ncbi:MAG: coat protein [Cressdnaviricota sp.]|nr:MAG: coat protein [Cressdnaviricota sp.]